MKYLLPFILLLSLFSCKKSEDKAERNAPPFKPIVLAFFPKDMKEVSSPENPSSLEEKSCVCIVTDPSDSSALKACSCLPEAYNEEAFLNILQEMRQDFDKAAKKENNAGMQSAVETARGKIENLFNQQTKDPPTTVNEEQQPPRTQLDNSCFCMVVDHPDITAIYKCPCTVGIRNSAPLDDILADLSREFFDEANQGDEEKLSAINEKYRKKVDELWMKEREGKTEDVD